MDSKLFSDGGGVDEGDDNIYGELLYFSSTSLIISNNIAAAAWPSSAISISSAVKLIGSTSICLSCTISSSV